MTLELPQNIFGSAHLKSCVDYSTPNVTDVDVDVVRSDGNYYYDACIESALRKEMFRRFGCLPPFFKNVSKETECRLDRMNDGERKILYEYFAGPPLAACHIIKCHFGYSHFVLSHFVLSHFVLTHIVFSHFP
jgi:hypothetical protein